MEEKSSSTSNPPPKPQKKSKKWWWVCGSCLFIVVIIILIATVGVRLFKTSSNTSDKTGAKRDYQFREPSDEALNREINCLDLYIYRYRPTKYKVLCLNLYKTSPSEISEKISPGTYDRVVLYGQITILDASAKPTNLSDFTQNFYDLAKFTDQITLPNLLGNFGIADLSYISKNEMPYPAIYYWFRTQQEVNETCHSPHNVGGCAQYNFLVEIVDTFIEKPDIPVKSGFYGRNGDADQLYSKTSWPINCQSALVMLHESAHIFARAFPFDDQGYNFIDPSHVLPPWFDENMAGLGEIVGPNWVCGESTITYHDGMINNQKVPNLDYIKYNTYFPPNMLGGKSPNVCEQAILNEVYRYLAAGKLEDTYPAFYDALRSEMHKADLANDQTFAKYVLELNGGSQTEKDFLNSKGCGI